MNDIFIWASKQGLGIIITIVVSVVIYQIGTMFMGRIVKRAVETPRRKDWHAKDIEKREKTLNGVLKNVWRVIIITIAAFSVFTLLFPEVSLGPLFASAGIVGVALGFGAQSLVKDFLSGIFIVSENQYRVGDIVEIDNASGTVERIGARSTVLRDADGNVHYLPNGMVQHVVNKTMGYSMARFSISVHPANELDDIIDLINETGKKLAEEEKWHKKIIDPPAFVSVGEFSASTVDLLISGKTQPSDQWSVTAEMRRRLLFEFEERQIGLNAPEKPASKKKK